MPAAAPRGRMSSVTKLAMAAAGSSHRRHGAGCAWPVGPGWNMRTLVLLPGAPQLAGQGPGWVPAGMAAVCDHLDWLYSGARRTAGRGLAATVAAWARACQAASIVSRMISVSTLSAAMPSGHRQLLTST